MKSLLTILLLFVLMQTKVTAQKKNKGEKEIWKEHKSLFWEVKKSPDSKPSYLYGTMHVSSKMVFHLSDSVFIKLKGVDIVALETNPEIWLEEMEKDRSLFNGRNGNFYQTAFDLSPPSKSDLSELLSANSNLMNNVLYRENRYNKNYQEDTYLDFFLYQSGRKLGKEITSLEDFKTSKEMSEKAGWPDKEDKKKKKKNYNSYYDPEMTLDNAYRKGDLNLLDSLQKNRSTENFYKWLLVERNKIMADNMDSIMRNQRSVLSAIGAAHLGGNEGMIELLRKKGYQVRPVKFDNIHESESKKEIEKLKYNTPLNLQFSSDSSFKALVPSKWFDVQMQNDYSIQVAADLPNGAFYLVTKLPHYGKLLGKNDKELLERLDSLIYENVPGKILEQRKITDVNGYLGVDITNKTRSGDIQKSRILITPTHYLLIKMNGIGDFINETDFAKRFFDSFELIEKKSTHFKSVNPPGGGFSALMPANYYFTEEKPAGYSTRLGTYTAYDNKKETVYFIKHRRMDDYQVMEQDTFELNMLSEFTAASGMSTITTRKQEMFNGYPSVIFTSKAKDGEGYLHGRIIIKGVDYYMLGHYGKSPKPDQQFLKSFSFKDYQYHQAYKTYTDTLCAYTVDVIDDPIENAEGLFEDENHFNYDRDFKDYKFTIIGKQIVHPKTGERVDVSFMKLHRYYFKANVDSLWKIRIPVISSDKSRRVIKERKWSDNNGEYCEVTMTDTATQKLMTCRVLYTNGSLYHLTYITDSSASTSPFYKRVVESFKPFPNKYKNDIFTNKARKLFEDIFAADSSIKAEARASLNYYYSNLKINDTTLLINTVNDARFKDLPNEFKIPVLSGFEKFTCYSAYPVLSDLYLENEDSVSVQMQILFTLAKNKNKKAYELIGHILNEHTPLSDESYAPEFIQVMEDSIELIRYIINPILELTGIPEYQFYGIKLLTLLNDQYSLDTVLNDQQKKTLINLTSLEIKRQRSAANKEKSEFRYNSDKNNYAGTLKKILQDPPKKNSDINLKFENELYNYLSLLSPYYKEKEVQNLFNKSLQINDPFLKLSLNGMLLKKGLITTDTVFSYYAKNDAHRLLTYFQLKECNRLNLVDQKLFSLENMAKAYLFCGEEDSKDTLTFVRKSAFSNVKNSGWVYVFKRVTEDENYSVESVNFLNEKNGLPVSLNLNEESVSYNPKKNDDYESSIAALFYKIRIENRPNAPTNGYRMLYKNKIR